MKDIARPDTIKKAIKALSTTEYPTRWVDHSVNYQEWMKDRAARLAMLRNMLQEQIQ